jgi:hypothetical protein
MRALLAVFILMGLAITYAQGTQWFYVDNHWMSGVIQDPTGCMQMVFLDAGEVSEVRLGFHADDGERIGIMADLLRHIEEPVWGGYGGGEGVTPTDSMLVGFSWIG